jgi:hypothetical protein
MLKKRTIQNENIICEYTSTDIAKSEYNPNAQDLKIHFHNGRVYGYNPVTMYMHHSFSSAPSQGKHLYEKIKANPKVNVRKIK